MGLDDFPSVSEILADKYPDIYFALTFGAIDPHPFPFLYAEDGITCEQERFSKKLPGDEIEVLYLVGLGLGHLYPVILPWLQKDPSRQLVILEDDGASFASWRDFDYALPMLRDPQVHLRYVPSKPAWKETIQACARDFPCRRIEVLALEKYTKTRNRFVSRLRLQLMRKTGMAYTYFAEALYAHVINTNLLHNAEHLAQAFEANRLAGQFTGIPAVICGAGPSLGAAVAGLKKLEDRALILAGGSAVTSLGNLGILPHIAFAIDPNQEEHDRFKASIVQEIPFLYGSRLRHDVFGTFNGPVGYIRSHTGGSGESWLEEQLGIAGESIGPELGPEAMSITTLAFATAVAMGCNPIILIGVDLAYVDSKRYAPGIMQDSSVDKAKLAKETEHLDRLVKRKNGQGDSVMTLIRWVMEAEALGKFAKKHSETHFFNASPKGLRIPHLSLLSLDEWIDQYCQESRDLRGRLHAYSEVLRFRSITPQKVQDVFYPLIGSLKTLQALHKEIDEELHRLEKEVKSPLDSGKLLALYMQCEEEVAFTPLLDAVGIAFDQIMRRQFLLQNKEASAPDQRVRHLNFTRAKWSHIQKVLAYYLSQLGRVASS